MERHPPDLVSLGFGVLFTLTGLAFLMSDVPVLPVVQLRWLVPLVLVVLGLWLLATVALSSRDTTDGGEEETQPVGEGGPPDRAGS